MLVRPQMLSILTTRTCTAACDHCCVGASPRATAAIPVERIHRLIDEAQRVPSIRLIAFSGGECFLLGRRLDALVGHASESGFTTRAITNGYWAVNQRAASERIRGLRARGLDELMISTGTFHERYVPIERIVVAARVATSAGILTRVSVETFDQSSFDEAILRDALRDLIAEKRLFIGSDPWTTDAGGRGDAMVTNERAIAANPDRATGRCEQILTVITVTPDQELVSCCGFPLEELPRLRIGSVADRALDDVLEQTPDELLKMWLHVAGPSGIAEFVARYVPGYRLPPAATICQACVALQRDDVAMRIVAEHARDIIQSVADSFDRLQFHESLRPTSPSHSPYEELPV